MSKIVPDEICLHIELGAAMVGGFVFTAPSLVYAGMCQECLDRYRYIFDGYRPLTEAALQRLRSPQVSPTSEASG